MANEKRLIPFGKKVTLDDLPFGAIFAFGDDCIAVKSEYRCDNGLIEAFIIDSGEQFWGGVHTAKEQNELMVQPLEIVEVDAVEVVHGRWEKYTDDRFMGYGADGRIRYRKVYSYKCSKCWNYTAVKHNYCPKCGAKMDGDGNG